MALVATAVGHDVAPFAPVAPSFYAACSPKRDAALQSALAVDPTLAKLRAAAAQIDDESGRVRGSSIDAGAALQAGSVTDLNRSVSGYELSLALSVSLPTHARDEERALRAEYAAQRTSLDLQERQRRAEIAAQVDARLADLQGSETVLAQTRDDLRARREDLRTATVKNATIRQPGSTGFADVHARRIELYAADIAEREASAQMLLDAGDLLAVAPGACGGAYVPMPSVAAASSPAPPSKSAPKPHS